VPETVESLAALIAAEPAPVLLLDACAVIDVARAPLLRDRGARIVRSAAEITQAAQRGSRGAWLVLAEMAHDEIQDVLPSETERTKKQSRETVDAYGRLHSVAQSLGMATERPHPDIELLIENLRRQAEDLAAACTVVLANDLIRAAAGKRVADGRRPASRGRDKYRDCEILETYLALARALRGPVGTSRAWLVTSNTSDYGRPGLMDAELARDLEAAGIVLVTDVSWARSQMWPRQSS
jgi:hypothetical protein